jgi:hypothetical protein
VGGRAPGIFFAKLWSLLNGHRVESPTALIGMKACAASHHRARELGAAWPRRSPDTTADAFMAHLAEFGIVEKLGAAIWKKLIAQIEADG